MSRDLVALSDGEVVDIGGGNANTRIGSAGALQDDSNQHLHQHSNQSNQAQHTDALSELVNPPHPPPSQMPTNQQNATDSSSSAPSPMPSSFTYAELDSTQESGDDSRFILYWFRVRHGDGNWLIGRRYSQFHALLDTLNTVDTPLVNALRLHLPRKQFLGSNTNEVISVRSFALLNFINSLGRSPRAMQLPVVLAFLEVDSAVRGASAFTRHCGVGASLMEGYLHKRREHRHSQWPLRYFCLTTQSILKEMIANGASGWSGATALSSAVGLKDSAAGESQQTISASSSSMKSGKQETVQPLALLYFDDKETIPWTPKGFLDLTYVPGQTAAVDIQDEGGKKRSLCFRLVTGKSEVLLQSPSKKELERWLDVLNSPAVTGIAKATRPLVSKTVSSR